MLVRARDIEGTVGAKFMLTRSAESFAMMCPTLLLRLVVFTFCINSTRALVLTCCIYSTRA